jgi:hypothetical protein
VVWTNEGRWYCSSCKAKGDAADLLVDTGKAADRQEAERILTERFGPPHTLERPHPTDMGKAQRLIEAYGDRLRHCWPWNKWLVWDGIRWALDDSGTVFSYSKTIAKKLYAEAGEPGFC